MKFVFAIVILFCAAIGFGQRFIPSYQVEVESGKDQTILRSDGCVAEFPVLKFEVKVSETGRVVAVKERKSNSIFLTAPGAALSFLRVNAKRLVANLRFKPFFVDHKPVAIRTVVSVRCKKE